MVISLTKNKQTIILNLNDLKWNIDTVQIEEERVTKANVSFPLIVYKDKKYGYVVLDGNHRLIKLFRLNKKSFKVFIITDKELNSTIL